MKSVTLRFATPSATSITTESLAKTTRKRLPSRLRDGEASEGVENLRSPSTDQGDGEPAF